jgi:hypothetical protein
VERSYKIGSGQSLASLKVIGLLRTANRKEFILLKQASDLTKATGFALAVQRDRVSEMGCQIAKDLQSRIRVRFQIVVHAIFNPAMVTQMLQCIFTRETSTCKVDTGQSVKARDS